MRIPGQINPIVDFHYCVFRRCRSRFRDDADQHSGLMAINIGAKRRWLFHNAEVIGISQQI